MAIGPDPFVALLSSIQDAQAASGGSPNPFTPGSQGIPGQGGVPSEAGGSPGVAGSIGGGVGGGGSVPGTATTGQNILADIAAGTASPTDPLAGGTIFQGAGVPGEAGDLGASVTGGDLGTLMSVLGGPTALLSILPSLVASDALGMPLDPSLLTTTSLAQLAFGGGEGGAGAGTEFGGSINSDGSFTPAVSSVGGSGGVNTIRSGAFPSLGGNDDNQNDRRDTSPGPGPNRGTGPSNAGR